MGLILRIRMPIMVLMNLLYLIVFLAGLRYLSSNSIMPYHAEFLGTDDLPVKFLELFLGGLRIIGAAFIAYSLLGIFEIRKLWKGQVASRSFFVFSSPIFIATAYTTNMVGELVGTSLFLSLGLLSLLVFTIASKQES